MKFFLTFGTHQFLRTLYEKFKPKHDIYLLDGDESSMLIVEKTGRSLFQSGKAYHIEYAAGDFQNATFAVMHHIPVPQEDVQMFQVEAKKRANLIKNQPGCLAVRLLSPVKKSDSFILASMWDSYGDYRRFQSTTDYDANFINSTNPQQWFTGKAYEKTYSIFREELAE